MWYLQHVSTEEVYEYGTRAARSLVIIAQNIVRTRRSLGHFWVQEKYRTKHDDISLDHSLVGVRSTAVLRYQVQCNESTTWARQDPTRTATYSFNQL